MDRKPRVLLVEDDAVTRTVFTEALERAGLQVDACASLHAARIAAARSMHALWLIDAHLPDGDGCSLLAGLRRAAPDTPAIAHTASRDAGLHARLRGAGFADVLVKPLPTAALVAAVAPRVGPAHASTHNEAPAQCEHARWDDAQALRALGGRRESLDALRGLFRQELPDMRMRCRHAVQAGDHAMLREALHRLQASAAFVGAAALMQCVHALRDAPDDSTLARFEHEVAALLECGRAERPIG